MVALGKDLFRSRAHNDSEDGNEQSYHSIDNLTGMSLLEHARPMFEVHSIAVLRKTAWLEKQRLFRHTTFSHCHLFAFCSSHVRDRWCGARYSQSCQWPLRRLTTPKLSSCAWRVSSTPCTVLAFLACPRSVRLW